MIIYHQNNVAAFAGNHTRFELNFATVISATSAAPAFVLIAQARSTSRFVFSRVHGRVN